MIASQFVRQYAVGAGVADDVATQEIVLTYVLQHIHELGLWARLAFKGGTSLRKTLFAETGRFSQDLDLLALDDSRPRPEDLLVDGMSRAPFHGIAFSASSIRYSAIGNFGAQIEYAADGAQGLIEIQVSHRPDLVLPVIKLPLLPQSYFARLEFEPVAVTNLNPIEMLAEKILACGRRLLGGSGKDVYDLYQFCQRPIDFETLRPLVCAKAWTDGVEFDPQRFLDRLEPRNFNWEELRGLLRRNQTHDQAKACAEVRARFHHLVELTPQDVDILADATRHQKRQAYDGLAEIIRGRAQTL